MATTVVLTSVVKDPSGRCRVRWNDGTELEFQSLADVQQWALSADLDVDLTKRICVAYAVARSADLSIIATVKDKNFTFDLSSPQPIKVQ